MNRSSLLAVCFLVCAGLALDCEWVPSTYPDHDLSFYAFQPAFERSCLDACCKQSDCDLVLVGFPGDGQPPCLQVNCTKDRDQCDIKPSALLKVYRKKSTEKTESARRGDQLLASPESRTNETTNIRCRQPMEIGSCRAAFPRFYYDVTNQSCRRFIFGGCGGNTNNFDSKKECEVTCSGVTEVSRGAEGPVKSERSAAVSIPPQNTEMRPAEFAERCGAEPLVGPCKAAFQRWYYNSKTGHCESFIYGGCQGNKNNYDSKESCMTACTATVLPSSKKVAANAEVSPEFTGDCTAASDPGPCRAAFRMFYYNPNTGTCQSFLYGGCRGNHNRYSTEEECMSRCSRHGSSDTRGKARDRWTSAIFLFITLAAISALLLAALVVVTLRRHRLSRRPSSVSDKEELLPDPDEQSSLESLTIPESPKPGQA